MENIVHALVTLLTAVLVAVGGPANGIESADRPAIVQAPVAPASDALKVYDTRGTIEEVRGSEIVVDGTTISIERETEIQGELRVGGKVDVEAKHAENGANVALKIQVHKADDSSSNSTSDLLSNGKEDRSSLTEREKEIEIEKEKESLDDSADRSLDDSPDAVRARKEQDKYDDQTQTATSDKKDDSKTPTTTTVKPEDSKSADDSKSQVEMSDNKPTQQQVESKQDSPKSDDSHVESKSSDDHKSDDKKSDDKKSEDHKSDDHKSKDSHD